jgi:uncharacterized membrane protein
MMMLSLLAFLAVVTDTGRLYFQKRSLQKNADLAALETALKYCRSEITAEEILSLGIGDMLATGEVLSATRNDFKGDATNSSLIVTRAGYAITVNISHKVPTSLFAQLLPTGDNETNLSAQATAKACEPTAQLAIRSGLVSLDDGIVNDLLGGILGVSLSVANWENLLNANINLLSLFDEIIKDNVASINLSAGEYTELLNANISLSDLFEIAADALPAEDNAASLVLNSLAAEVPGSEISLGQLINVATDDEYAGLNTGIDIFDLVQGSIQLAGENNAIGVIQNIDILGLANASLEITAIEPPILSAIGNPSNDEISVSTSQVKALIGLDIDLNLNSLGLPNLVDIDTKLDLRITAGNANATVVKDSQICTPEEKSLISEINTSAVALEIGRNTGTTTLAPAKIAELRLLGISVVAINLTAQAHIGTSQHDEPIGHTQEPPTHYLPDICTASMPLDDCEDFQKSFESSGDLNQLLVFDDISVTTEILPGASLGVVSLLINGLLSGVTNLVVIPLTASLDEVLSNLLFPIINPLLNSLGINLAYAELGAALTCENDNVRLVN